MSHVTTSRKAHKLSALQCSATVTERALPGECARNKPTLALDDVLSPGGGLENVASSSCQIYVGLAITAVLAEARSVADKLNECIVRSACGSLPEHRLFMMGSLPTHI